MCDSVKVHDSRHLIRTIPVTAKLLTWRKAMEYLTLLSCVTLEGTIYDLLTRAIGMTKGKDISIEIPVDGSGKFLYRGTPNDVEAFMELG